jgi:hypothetical protein
MDNFRQLGNSLSIPIPADGNAFTGRECPQPDCEGYFKTQFGTGLKGEGLPCHCPYCGHIAGHEQFWTKEQIKYATSVAMRKVTDSIYKDLKSLEFDQKPDGAFGIGISMKVEPGRAIPIHNYREKELETEVVCVNCTLRYAVYGVFAFCPDCGQHNSLQILDTNLNVVEKLLGLAAGAERLVSEKLIEDALEDCVSTFDGFGRELCRLHADKARTPAKVERLTFQNLTAAKLKVLAMFGVDLSAGVTPGEWRVATTGFQKRHLGTHALGVVDPEYLARTGDSHAVVGRKLRISVDEVGDVARILGKMARRLSEDLEKARPSP